ncbi:MAG: phosphotransferase family protein [Dehalococcoidia bacterium]|nr:phosphotransferase family protein [Dehalococcoidia bacterium]
MKSNAALTPPLERYFTGRLNSAVPAVLTRLRRIAVGHSRAMMLASVRFDDGSGSRERSFVLRIEQGGVFGTDSFDEVRLMRALHTAGYPVAPVRWYEPDPAVLGNPFFVMDFVEGSAEVPDEATLCEFLRVLHRQHELDWRKAGLGFLAQPQSPRDGAVLQVERWYRTYRQGTYLPIPLLEEGAAWLRRHAIPAERIGLVHGDSGPSNFMFADGKVTAVTDWEFAHLGDPIEDWVYMATMRGARMMDRDAWARLFKDEAGVTVDEAQWTYWDAFNHFKGACANITTLRVFSEGLNPAPNMAAIGTGLHLVFLQRLAEIVGAH